jgi:AAA+ superfamily predicted ATPase
MSDPEIRLELSNGPYASGAAHLRDELARVEVLVRAQVVRWRLTIAATKPEQWWGMVHVTEAEIEHYLASPITAPDHLPDDLAQVLAPFWKGESDGTAVIRAAVDATPPHVDLRVERLRTRFGLSAAQLDVVLLALLPELDMRYGRVLGYLGDDASHPHPPPGLLGQLLHPKAPTLEQKRALFDPSGSLLRWHVVQIGDAGVRVDERIASFLHGSDAMDARLERIVEPMPANVAWVDLFVPPETKAALQDVIPNVVVLRGSRGSGRAKAAGAICAMRGVQLLRFDVEGALRDPARWDLLLALAYREALLRDAALYVDGIDRLDADDRPPALFASLAGMAERVPVLTFLAAEMGSDESHHARYVRFDFPPPHFELRRAVWQAVLPQSLPDRDAVAEKLAGAFQLSEGQIREAVAAANASAGRRTVRAADLHEACRKQSGRRLLGFARRIEPTRGLTLDDVVMTEANKAQLRELLDRVRLRARIETEMDVSPAIAHGRGLLVLFTGPSGTGKTLAAEVIANQQGVDLYKVDASAVVSKWVGETEKNLSRIFADAESSDSLLFFDECDSLFGHRGDISEGRDRWANLQTNYLLQRVEDYSGVVIMASNLRKNIDEAFLRRIQIVADFPPPDAPLRLEIWKRSLAGESNGVSADELREVAERFNVTGGTIRNVTIGAMYRALAKARTQVLLRDVVDGVAREYQKQGRSITKGDFGERFYAWALADVIMPPGRG